MTIAFALLIGIMIGFAIGHVVAVIHASETLVKASTLYKELILRGDAAMAMLKKVGDELEKLGQGKRVVLADDLKQAKQAIDVGYNKRIEKV